MANQGMKPCNEQEEEYETGLTCPSCRITCTNSSTRHRSICPFCGSFYDPAAEIDFELRRLTTPPHHFRRDSLSISPSSYQDGRQYEERLYQDGRMETEARDHFRLPRIVSFSTFPFIFWFIN